MSRRPTRWTRGPRVTFYGKGGWHINRYGFGYTNPGTGNGVSSGWRLLTCLRMRREQEARIAARSREEGCVVVGTGIRIDRVCVEHGQSWMPPFPKTEAVDA